MHVGFRGNISLVMPSAQTSYAQENPAAELSIHSVQKNAAAGRLCLLNLAVHGLEGEIKHGGNINSYYDDPHDATAASTSSSPTRHSTFRGQGTIERHGRPGSSLPLRPAAHQQRQLPLDSTLPLHR